MIPIKVKIADANGQSVTDAAPCSNHGKIAPAMRFG
jgi:hypothetical protein